MKWSPAQLVPNFRKNLSITPPRPSSLPRFRHPRLGMTVTILYFVGHHRPPPSQMGLGIFEVGESQIQIVITSFSLNGMGQAETQGSSILASMKPNVMGAPGKPGKGQRGYGPYPHSIHIEMSDMSTRDKAATCPVCPPAEHARLGITSRYPVGPPPKGPTEESQESKRAEGVRCCSPPRGG